MPLVSLTACPNISLCSIPILHRPCCTKSIYLVDPILQNRVSPWQLLSKPHTLMRPASQSHVQEALYRLYITLALLSLLQIPARTAALERGLTLVIPFRTSSSGATSSSSCLPRRFSMLCISSTSYWVTRLTAPPPLPARAVRPTRWT